MEMHRNMLVQPFCR